MNKEYECPICGLTGDAMEQRCTIPGCPEIELDLNIALNKFNLCDCGGHYILKTNKHNQKAFYGCDNYPKCKNTKTI